jgi:hypothetical protein
MAIEVETHIPRRIIIGNAYNFTAGDDDYPASGGWTAQIAFKIGNTAPITFPGVASGDAFLFTLTNANTATLVVGDNLVCLVFSDGTNREASEWREVEVLQNPLAADPPSYAQAQVTLLQAVIASFNTSSHNIVNFNGQSFTRGSVSEYQKQLVYYEARVIRENRDTMAERGVAPRRTIEPTFASNRRWPFTHWNQR